MADNGPGIAPEDQQKIFYVFRRAATAYAAKVPGKGVGLAWAKSVVANYDGSLSVESTPGEGAVFVATLSEKLTRPEPTGMQADEREVCVAADAHPAG